jgi:cyclopropane fatty-acyl-phospholipid synthase-like methyltransferase
MTDAPEPGYYERLEFNAPLSTARADAIAVELASSGPRTVVDLGCGWGELMLRTLAAASTATGWGVDSDERALARGRANAADRGLDERVVFEAGDGAEWDEPADVVICVGADHAFGDQGAALAALHGLVRPGGRVLFGSGFWRSEPSAEQAAAVGMSPESLTDLAGLIELAISHGFRPLTIQTANADEWEQFESGYLADWETWLLAYGDHPDADGIRAKADAHRTEWLRGYGGVLGFTYLTLGVAGSQEVTAT